MILGFFWITYVSLALADIAGFTFAFDSDSTCSDGLCVPSDVRPSLNLDKEIYDEGEPITASFVVGSKDDPFYSSSEAPSPGGLNYHYPEWSVGLYMRDADPQGGGLSPLVGIKLCGKSECDQNLSSFSFHSGEVTFGSGVEYSQAMKGVWPLLAKDHGPAYDAYVLDANGAAAIGPFEFIIRDKYFDDFNAGKISTTETPSLDQSSNNAGKVKRIHGLKRYNHANKKRTSRQDWAL